MKIPVVKKMATRAASRSAAVILASLFLLTATHAEPRGPLVFAAASLKNALDAASNEWTRETGQPVTISYGASSTLAKQVEAGAPVDIFISADLDWMDYLAQRNLIRPATRKNLLGNDLVLIAPNGTPHVEIKSGMDLAGMLKGGRLAVADPNGVPAGKYAKVALTSLGLWPSVEQSLAPAENVRAALLLVSRGEAPYGIVYRTDAAAEPGVTVVGVFPDDSHPPIIYPAALLNGAQGTGADKFLQFLESPKAGPFFEQQGFKLIK